jgi:predicted RNA-binding protein YlqC (UPF0109 family)
VPGEVPPEVPDPAVADVPGVAEPAGADPAVADPAVAGPAGADDVLDPVAAADSVGLADLAGDDAEDDDPYNRVVGAVPRGVLEYIATAIVDQPEAVHVETTERGRGVLLSLHVAPEDMGQVIGRRGRVAQAIRAVVRAAGAQEGIEASVDIVD